MDEIDAVKQTAVGPSYNVATVALPRPPVGKAKRTFNHAERAYAYLHRIASFVERIVRRQAQDIDPRRIEGRRRFLQGRVREGDVTGAIYLAPLYRNRRSNGQAVVGYAAMECRRAGILSYRLIRTRAYHRRAIAVHRTFPIEVRGKDLVYLLTVERAVVETDLIQHPGVGVALPLDVAEIHVVARLRRGAPKVTLPK